MPELIGASDIAKRFGVSQSAVSHWIRRSQPGAPSRLRPSFPRPRHESRTGKLWSWAEVNAWGDKWQAHHPGSLPGLNVEDYDAQATDERKDASAGYPVSKTLKGFKPQGCTCPEGAISLNCPVHT